MRDNLFSIFLIALGIAIIIVPLMGIIKFIEPFELFGYSHVIWGILTIALGVVLLLLGRRSQYKGLKVCKKCGWQGPKKRWEAAGGCPICTAKKRASR